jgi:hypothetical protein
MQEVEGQATLCVVQIKFPLDVLANQCYNKVDIFAFV